MRIYDTDSYTEMARKIYMHFDVLQSCSIYGFVQDGERLIPKGELVVNELQDLYDAEYIRILSNGKRERRFKYKKNSIGGPIAHKIFSFEKRIVDNEPRYNIWRTQ